MSSTLSPVSRIHRMPHGSEVLADGTVRFRLWGPAHPRIEIMLDGHDPVSMVASTDGWHELVTDQASVGTRYRFVLPDGLRVPDPASRFQPDSVHGPSQVTDPAGHAWTDGDWQGRPWHEAVIYELHVGTFSPAGTFRAAVERLDHLVDLGVTAIQLMPLSEFAGSRNWGYDGVLPYAPDSSHGRPDDLKLLVQEAHARGLMVLLDAVYNHFGPDGNYLSAYAPAYFTDRHHTPWGMAIDYDGPDSRPVRDFAIHNALYWIEEFHLDGLRLDAVHAILDDSPEHLLDELRRRVREAAGGRHVHLILENEENEAFRLGDGVAQWNDDLHHVLHTAATGEGAGYYGEYLHDTAKLGRALAEGFAFQGETMVYRGRARGEASAHLPPTAFVAFVQNHDQIGNRAFGERIHMTAPAEAVRAVTAVCHLAPQIPMLFMGEEWAAAQPFPFFCAFDDELGEAVRTGRLEEFARFPEFADEAVRARIPDPVAESTFRSAKLDWSALDQPPHDAVHGWYRRLLAKRREVVVPLLPALTAAGTFEVVGDEAVVVRWRAEDGRGLQLRANLKEEAQPGFSPPEGQVFWQEGRLEADLLGAWSVCWSHTEASPR